LRLARERFPLLGAVLELVCTDLHEWSPEEQRFDLIHAALVFEYVQAAALLRQIHAGLNPGGTLSVVLQLPVEGLPGVSQTRFTSLEKLSPLFHHYTPPEFNRLARQQGFECTASQEVTLASGKTFFFGCYQQRISDISDTFRV
ncbi:MAG TPA: class I SAM-dependent methyltransferase, partial [Anaerolineaceae bacterium]